MPRPHLHNQYAWLCAFVDSYHVGESQLVATGINLGNLTQKERTARVERLVARLEGTSFAVLTTRMYRVFAAAEAIFAAKAHTLEILHEGDLLFKSYEIIS